MSPYVPASTGYLDKSVLAHVACESLPSELVQIHFPMPPELSLPPPLLPYFSVLLICFLLPTSNFTEAGFDAG